METRHASHAGISATFTTNDWVVSPKVAFMFLCGYLTDQKVLGGEYERPVLLHLNFKRLNYFKSGCNFHHFSFRFTKYVSTETNLPGGICMKNITLHLSMTFLLTAAGCSFAAAVTVNVENQHQKISGFGTCSAWCGTLTASEGELLFSPTKGAGLSLHRVMIEKNGLTQSEIANTKLASGYGVTVWGTPWYCKNGVKVAGKDYDTLYEKDYQAWADVLANAATSMKSAGTPLYAISSGNEADLGWTKYDTRALANWVGNYFGPTMAAKAPDTKVMGLETCNWYGFSNYYKVFKADVDAWNHSAILATHLYGGTPTLYPEIQAAGKEFWQTEIYDTDTRVEDPGMGSALRVCKLIHESLTKANMNAWHFWWIKPCSGCNNGALWAESTRQPTKRLWVMGNWSRYVRPGFIRIDATETPTNGVTVSAFRDSTLSRVVIVAYNKNNNSVSQEFSLPGTAPEKLTPCITDPTKDLVEQSARTLSSSDFTYSLPAQSVTSLVVDCKGTSQQRVSAAGAEKQTDFRVQCIRSIMTLDFPSPGSGLTSVKLFNLRGEMVKNVPLRNLSGTAVSLSVDLSGLPRDCYLVRVENSGTTVNAKAVLYL